MQTTTRPTYSQVYGMAMQLTPEERMRLLEELNRPFNEALDNSRPYTVEEVRCMVAEAEADIKAAQEKNPPKNK